MENKTFCSNCKVHCYTPIMQEKIREVMRFSGPRMIFYHPIMALNHVITSKREKERLKEVKIKKILWLILGFIGLGLGALGAVLPILPTVPFLLLAAVSFAKSSDKLNNWFINTKLYKNNLESYVKGQGMSFKSKVKVIITVTLLIAIGLTLMLIKGIYIPCIILAIVWVTHIVYFTFYVKTYKLD